MTAVGCFTVSGKILVILGGKVHNFIQGKWQSSDRPWGIAGEQSRTVKLLRNNTIAPIGFSGLVKTLHDN